MGVCTPPGKSARGKHGGGSAISYRPGMGPGRPTPRRQQRVCHGPAIQGTAGRDSKWACLARCSVGSSRRRPPHQRSAAEAPRLRPPSGCRLEFVTVAPVEDGGRSSIKLLISRSTRSHRRCPCSVRLRGRSCRSAGGRGRPPPTTNPVPISRQLPTRTGNIFGCVPRWSCSRNARARAFLRSRITAVCRQSLAGPRGRAGSPPLHSPRPSYPRAAPGAAAFCRGMARRPRLRLCDPQWKPAAGSSRMAAVTSSPLKASRTMKGTHISCQA
jgi:hypothetical protein